MADDQEQLRKEQQPAAVSADGPPAAGIAQAAQEPSAPVAAGDVQADDVRSSEPAALPVQAAESVPPVESTELPATTAAETGDADRAPAAPADNAPALEAEAEIPADSSAAQEAPSGGNRWTRALGGIFSRFSFGRSQAPAAAPAETAPVAAEEPVAPPDAKDIITRCLEYIAMGPGEYQRIVNGPPDAQDAVGDEIIAFVKNETGGKPSYDSEPVRKLLMESLERHAASFLKEDASGEKWQKMLLEVAAADAGLAEEAAGRVLNAESLALSDEDRAKYKALGDEILFKFVESEFNRTGNGVGHCLFMLQMPDDLFSRAVDEPINNLQRYISALTKKDQAAAPYTRDAVRKLLGETLAASVPAWLVDGTFSKKWSDQIESIAQTDIEGARRATDYVFGQDPAMAGLLERQTEEVRAQVRGIAYNGLREQAVKVIDETMGLLSRPGPILDNELAIRGTTREAQYAKIRAGMTQLAAIENSEFVTGPEQWPNFLANLGQADPAGVAEMAAAVLFDNPDDRPLTLGQVVASLSMLMTLPDEAKRDAFGRRGVTPEGFAEKTFSIVNSYTRGSLARAGLGKQWFMVVENLMKLDPALVGGALDRVTAGLAADGFAADGARVAAGKTDIMAVELMNTLRLGDEDMAAHLAATGRTEDELEQEFLATMDRYAALTREAGIFERAWPSKMKWIAGIDPGLAGEAARRALAAGVERWRSANRADRREQAGLIAAFESTGVAVQALTGKGYYYDAAEAAADLYESSRQCMDPPTQELCLNGLSGVVKDWQKSLAGRTPEERETAEAAINEFVTARLLRAAPRPQQAAPAGP